VHFNAIVSRSYTPNSRRHPLTLGATHGSTDKSSARVEGARRLARDECPLGSSQATLTAEVPDVSSLPAADSRPSAEHGG